MSWVNRVRHPQTSPLKQVQDAAENLAGQAGVSPERMRVVFQTVADVTIIVSAVTATTLAAVHLYKSLFPRNKENHPVPEAAGGGRLPPRRNDPRAGSAAEDRGGYEDNGARSR